MSLGGPVRLRLEEKQRRFWKRVADSARHCWLHLTGILGLSILSTPIALLMPLPLKIVVDAVLGQQPLPRWLSRLLPATLSHTAFLLLAAGLLLFIALRNYRLADLRQQYSIVLQEPMLFSTTIAANIAFARPEASRAELVEAARMAAAHDFIMRLPEGYETPIGEGGLVLSGGERQRLAVARAFLKNAPVLTLDEPTSAVDTNPEQGIIDALEKLTRDRTTFIIAHRLSTLEDCDQVLILQGGHLKSVVSSLQQAREELLHSFEPPVVPPYGPVLVG